MSLKYCRLPLRYANYKLSQEYSNIDLWYFVCFIAGIVAYFNLSSEPITFHVVIFIIIPSLSAVFISRGRIFRSFLSICILTFSLGVLIAKYRADSLHVSIIEGSLISQIKGKVEAVKPTFTSIQVTLRDVRVIKTERYLEKVRITIPNKYAKDVIVNDEISLLAKLFKPKGSVIPGGYNFGFHAHFAGIGATGYAMSEVKILLRGEIDPFSRLSKIRKNIYERLVEILGKTNGNFASAIILGESKGLDKEVMKNMRTSGISHILCVSGLHLSLAAMIFFISFRCILNIPNIIAYNFNVKFIAAIASIFGSYLYLELSGKQIAASRAFIMTSIFMGAMIIGRKPYAMRSIAIAAGVILSLSPEYVFHPSFQLSFIAVLSLISGYQFYLKNDWIIGRSSGVLAAVRFYFFSNIYSSFLASIMTAPIVISHFYFFSTYSVPMNLIAVPIMSFFLMPLAIIALVLMPLGWDAYYLKILGFFINIIIKAAKYTSDLPGSVWYFGYITPLSLIIFLFGFFWLCIWQTGWRIFGIFIIAISGILMSYSPKPDFIYDINLEAIGTKNNDGKLVVYSDAPVPSFNSQYWANWYGQQNVELFSLTNSDFVSTYGQKISINHNNKNCKAADIQINLNAKCRANLLAVDADLFRKVGVILIFCNDDSCIAKYDNYNRFITH